MSEAILDSNVSYPTPSFGPTTLWQVNVLAILYGAIFVCGTLYNSAVLCILISLSKNGWTAVNHLIAYQSLAGLAAITIAVPLYLYMLTTGDRNPVLCTFYDWYVFTFCAMSCVFIIALGLLRYTYVFHYRFLQYFRQKTITVMPLVFVIGTTVLYTGVRYFFEPPLDKGIRITLCATRFTRSYKNSWPVVLSSHIWMLLLGLAYFRILRKLRAILAGQLPLFCLRKVNLVDARTSALTAIILEGAILMAQIWNIIDPDILPTEKQFFFQELSSLFVHVIHFSPAMLYFANHQESHRSLVVVFQMALPCSKRKSRVDVAVIDN